MPKNRLERSNVDGAAIGVVKYDQLKLPAASRNLSGNLSDSFQ
jgi:hypothetical protein